MQVFDVQFALAPPIPPRGAELAGFVVYQTVTGDISLGYGAALAVTVAVVTALVAGGLVLVSRIRMPSSRSDPGGSTTTSADARSATRRRGVPLRLRRLATGAATLLLVRLADSGRPSAIVVASTQLERHLTADPPRIGLPVTFDAYTSLLASTAWRNAAITTVLITTLATAVALVIASATAYPLSRYRLRGGGVLTVALLGTQLIPPIALAFPALLIFIKLGLRDTIPGLVLVHAAFWTPVLVWLLRSAFGSVPVELERAARMDGASRLGAIVRVVVPATAPVNRGRGGDRVHRDLERLHLRRAHRWPRHHDAAEVAGRDADAADRRARRAHRAHRGAVRAAARPVSTADRRAALTGGAARARED